MKLDTSLAWYRAHGAVVANRDMLFALAGVFFLLPALAMGLLAPQDAPVINQNMSPDEMANALQATLTKLAPFVVPVLVMNWVGMLSLIALFADRRRPTVAQAMAQGLRVLVPYVAAQMLFGLAYSVAGGVVVQLVGLGGKGGQGLAMVIVLGGMLYGLARLMLLAPVMVAEGLFNPVAGLVRAWRLASGNVAVMALFMMALVAVMFIAEWAAVGVFGSLAAIMGGAQAAHVVAVAINAVGGTVFSVYVAALITGFHAQLASAQTPPRSPFG